MLAYTPLGYSLPDLTVEAIASSAASWDGPLTVTLNVKNIGASSLNEPLNLTQGATSSADAPATTVEVFASKKRGAAPIQIGTINVPATSQNSVNQVTQTLTLPPRPAKFPATGKLFLTFNINPDRAIIEHDYTNNVRPAAQPVNLTTFLPDLEVTGLDTSPVLNPGDTIQSNIRVTNFGTADSATQGPVTVHLVASIDRNFGPGDSILQTFTIDNLVGVSRTASNGAVAGDANLDPGVNTTTLIGNPITLPTQPGQFFIGVVIDPDNIIAETGERGGAGSSSLAELRQVGPRTDGLPPAGVISPFSPSTIPLFPNANTATGTLSSGATPTSSTGSGAANRSLSASLRSLNTTAKARKRAAFLSYELRGIPSINKTS